MLIAFGCSSENDASGCGNSSTQRCDINAEATLCGDRITLECFDGETPQEESQCERAIVDDDEAIYCCVNAAADGQPAEVAPPAGGAGGG
ncbi:MAG: hypothetical protein HOV80_35055 [Polyangiaceae bacterium]|nr:hypothetical protein [Polyangiaceae bacterium]